MARSGIGEIIYYGAIVGGSYLAYRAALTGSFGKAGQNAAYDACKSVKGADKCCADITGGGGTILDKEHITCTAAPPGTTPPATGQGKCTVAATGHLDAMQLDNVNIVTQMRAWQFLRAQRGENSFDWAAFRTHVIAITTPNGGAKDPGASPPPEFCNWSPA